MVSRDSRLAVSFQIAQLLFGHSEFAQPLKRVGGEGLLRLSHCLKSASRIECTPRFEVLDLAP